MNNVVDPRLKGEDLRADDLVKQALFPHANRAIVDLMEADFEHVRSHLAAPTVMAVAAADMFRSTMDRPRGVAMLRDLADILERQEFDAIPWGPNHPGQRKAIHALIEARSEPHYDPFNDDSMLDLMADLEREFNEAMDRLVKRYAETVETADEFLVGAFLMQFMIKRYGRLEDPEEAWTVVRQAALDEGWIEP
jgi:hypothetical protein